MLASDAIKPLLSVLVLCGKLAFPSEWKQFTSGFMDAPMLCLLRPVAVQVGTLIMQRCLGPLQHSRSFVACQSPASGACSGCGSLKLKCTCYTFWISHNLVHVSHASVI
jgi:hypothetical protein